VKTISAVFLLVALVLTGCVSAEDQIALINARRADEQKRIDQAAYETIAPALAQLDLEAQQAEQDLRIAQERQVSVEEHETRMTQILAERTALIAGIQVDVAGKVNRLNADYERQIAQIRQQTDQANAEGWGKVLIIGGFSASVTLLMLALVFLIKAQGQAYVLRTQTEARRLQADANGKYGLVAVDQDTFFDADMRTGAVTSFDRIPWAIKLALLWMAWKSGKLDLDQWREVTRTRASFTDDDLSEESRLAIYQANKAHQIVAAATKPGAQANDKIAGAVQGRVAGAVSGLFGGASQALRLIRTDDPLELEWVQKHLRNGE